MKKLDPPSSQSTRIVGLRLFRDDLDMIMEVMRRDVAAPKLSDSHFEFDSIDEFVLKKGVRPRVLEIEARRSELPFRSISVRFEGTDAWLYASKETPFYEIKEFIESKAPEKGSDTFSQVRVPNKWL